MSGRDPAALALDIRAWALPVLNGTDAGCVPHVDRREAWSLFLEAEGCASVLLRRWPVGEKRPEILAIVAASEAQRTLTTRGQVLEMARALTGFRPPVVFLKGVTEIMSSDTPVVSGDIDLLTESEAAADLVARLRRLGYRDQGRGRTLRHEPVLGRSGEVPVEVHFTVGYPGEDGAVGVAASAVLEQSAPHPDLPVLRRPRPAHQARMVLLHSCSEHLNRRGRLRDILLLAMALERCPAPQRNEIERDLGSHPLRRALTSQLEMGLALAERRQPGDPFRPEAAVRYRLWNQVRRGWLPRDLAPAVFDAAFARLASSEEVRVLSRRARNLPAGDSPFALVSVVERRLGPVGRRMRIGLRYARLGAASLWARIVIRGLGASEVR